MDTEQKLRYEKFNRFLTKAEVEAGGESPISQTVRRAVPKPLAARTKYEHSAPSRDWLNCAICVSFIAASSKQVPPLTERLTYKRTILVNNCMEAKAFSTINY